MASSCNREAWIGYQENFYMEEVVKYWNRLLREDVEPLSPEYLKKHVDMVPDVAKWWCWIGSSN